jgi:hypothetical protein
MSKSREPIRGAKTLGGVGGGALIGGLLGGPLGIAIGAVVGGAIGLVFEEKGDE